MKNRLLVSIVAAGAGLAIIAPAIAAPNGKNSELISLTCDNGQTFDVIVNGGGFSPGHVVGSNVKFIPVEISFTGTFTDADGNVEQFSETQSKGNAPRNKTLISCDFGESFSDPTTGESFELDGNVVGFMNR